MVRKRQKKIPLGIRFMQVALFVILIMGAIGIGNMFFVSQAKISQSKENDENIQALSQEIKGLEEDIKNSDSPEFVEKVAREDLGMVKPREVIFIDKNKERQNKKNKVEEDLK